MTAFVANLRFPVFLFLFLVFSLHSVRSLAQSAATEIKAADNAPANMVWVSTEMIQSGIQQKSKQKTLKGFFIDRFETTQLDYEQVMNNNPSYFKDPNRPVEKVTWFDAEAYCKKTGKRLPTEWEWETAIKAGTDTPYYWGMEIDDDFAWHKKNANQQTHPVGEKKPNRLGLFDMAGNVWEWTSSDHENGGKVLRGGSWRNSARSLRSAHRISSLPHFKYHYVGFRCALSAFKSPKPHFE